MPVAAASIDALGKPKLDGVGGLIRLGVAPDRHQEHFVWAAGARGGLGAWVGKPRVLMVQTHDNFFVSTNMEWGYYTSGAGTGLAASPMNAWPMVAIPYAGEMFAAGFDLQMMLRGKGNGNTTYALQIAPWFFQYGTVLGVDNKLSLNNDSSDVPFALLPGLDDVASAGPSVTVAAGTVLPANTTVAFALNAAAPIPNAAGPNAGAGNFVSNPAAGAYYLTVEHPSLDRPVRLNYTGVAGNQFTGCTVAFTAARQAAEAAKINNLVIPNGAVIYQARTAPYAPSGANPNALTSWSGNVVAVGDGNVGYGPILTTAVANTIAEIATGWKDVRRAGNPAAGEGALYRSFASGMPDRARPYTPVKRFLYVTFYARLKGVPNGTTGLAQGRAAIEARYRWVGYPA